MTSQYYITSSDGDIFELDATLSVRIDDNGSLTSYKIETGEELSDHYTNNNLVVAVNGRISDIKSKGSDQEVSKTTDQFISGLRAIKASKKPFSFTWREDKSSGGVTYQINNCLFTSLSIEQNASAGYSRGVDKHSYLISMGIQQARFAKSSEIVVESDDLIVDMVAKKKAGAGSTSSFEDDEVPREPLADKLGYLGNYAIDLFGG